MSIPSARRIRFLCAAVLTFLAWTSCVVHSRADVVFAWNELLLHLTLKSSEGMPSLLEARAFAVAHVAMQAALADATAGIRSESERPSAQRAAVLSAARTVLLQLFPNQRTAIEALAQRHQEAIPSGAATARGEELGAKAGDRVMLDRAHDGWTEVIALHPPYGPRPDSSERFATLLASGEKPPPSPWLRAKPFALKSPQQFPVAEVREFTRDGQVLTSSFLKHSKLFAGIDPGELIASPQSWHALRPVMVWNRIARQLAAVRHLDLAGQARLLAALNAALADALLSSLHWRHTLGGWRAFVVNRWSDELLVRSPDHVLTPPYDTPHVETHRLLIPPVPNYPSVRATLAGAAQSVLREFFGTDDIVFTLPVIAHAQEAQPAGRVYPSISAVAREHAYAASLEGDEIREACIAGYSHGAAVGSYIAKRRPFMRR